MIQLLPAGQTERIRPLFQGPHLGLIIDAVIAGNSPSTIWVDNDSEPASAIIWDGMYSYYLAGTAKNDEFNYQAARLIGAEWVPDAAARGLRVLKVYDASGDWASRIPDLFRNVALSIMARVFFAFSRPGVAHWKSRVPAGFQLSRLDEAILADRHLENVDAVAAEIRSGWPSLERFLSNGFGVCLLHGDAIICWCTAEYVSAGKCGIGIETLEAYMGRGFATLTANAFVELALSRGIRPHWDSWKANQPSIAVAEKVGFEKLAEYEIFLGRIRV